MGIHVTETNCVFCGITIPASTAFACCNECGLMSDPEMLNLLTALNDLKRLHRFYQPLLEERLDRSLWCPSCGGKLVGISGAAVCPLCGWERIDSTDES